MKLFVRSLIVGTLGIAPAVVAGAAFALGGAIGAPQAPTLPSPAGFPQGLPATLPQTGVPMPSSPTMGQQPSPAAPEEAQPKEATDAHGLVGLVDEALSQIKLEPQQTASLGVLGDMVKKRETAVHKAKIALMDALAGQLASGRVDEKALAPEIEAFVKASESARPVMRAAFEELHDILDAAQRKQFVDALQKGVAEREKAYSSGSWLDQWAKDFGLSSDQESQIRSAVEGLKPAVAARAKQLARVIDAFKGDKFSIDEIEPATDTEQRATEMAKGLVHLTEAISGVLTPEQRTQAAAKIHEKIAQPAAEEPASPDMGTAPAVPGQAEPAQTAPAQAVPGQALPGQAAPGQAIPGVQTPSTYPGMPNVPAPRVIGVPTSSNDEPLGSSTDALWGGGARAGGAYRAGGYRAGGVGYGGVGYGGGYRAGGVAYGRSAGYHAGYGGYGYPALGGVGYVL